MTRTTNLTLEERLKVAVWMLGNVDTDEDKAACGKTTPNCGEEIKDDACKVAERHRRKPMAIKEGVNWSIDELAVSMQTCFTSYKLDDGSYGYFFDIDLCKAILHDLVEPREKQRG